jgi:hypothetical protein
MKGIGARERGSRGAWELGSGDEDVACGDGIMEILPGSVKFILPKEIRT